VNVAVWLRRAVCPGLVSSALRLLGDTLGVLSWYGSAFSHLLPHETFLGFEAFSHLFHIPGTKLPPVLIRGVTDVPCEIVAGLKLILKSKQDTH